MRCRWGWHDWRAWRDIVDEASPKVAVMQIRYCDRCERAQKRWVSA